VSEAIYLAMLDYRQQQQQFENKTQE